MTTATAPSVRQIEIGLDRNTTPEVSEAEAELIMLAIFMGRQLDIKSDRERMREVRVTEFSDPMFGIDRYAVETWWSGAEKTTTDYADLAVARARAKRDAETLGL